MTPLDHIMLAVGIVSAIVAAVMFRLAHRYAQETTDAE